MSLPLLRLALRRGTSSLRTASCKSIGASKDKGKGKPKPTATLVPGSKQPITDEAAQQEYAKAETSMQGSVEWYRKECAMVETRASGRITPALLSPVRVKLPNSTSDCKLEEVATVGVRDGSTLLITVFEEHTIKFVEQALYDSKIPNIVPQRQDSRTIKIPIPKPTVEARSALYTAAHRKAEDIRVQIRKQYQTSVKRGKYAKHSIELEEFQKLNDRYVAEVDKILASLKKATGAK
ncbi:ribosome recycling factor domain-containing protein [Collybia nuda]|uniref:Ribosome recycling factor domain-containing protein n=1 Tax=Collybia nuda TaxID=64659 RepID=A0A9P5Y9E6_9AGAR|nr:ribosome recycling factor domain-containing protein [Collybia nuda]